MTGVEDIYELAPMQRGMLYESLSGDSGQYVVQLQYGLRGSLDVSRLERAVRQMVRRHPAARTSIHWEELDHPVQVVHRDVSASIDQHDWRDVSRGELPQRLKTWRTDERGRAFDLRVAPLMRFSLIQHDRDEYEFIWTFHHIALEGWSAAILLNDILLFYRGDAIEWTAPPPYRDYIAWIQQQDRGLLEEYWRGQLEGFSKPVLLGPPPSGGDTTTPPGNYASEVAELCEADTQKLQDTARRLRLTPNTIVQGAWALLLRAYTNADDLLYGSVVSGRSAPVPAIDSMVGLFINTLPVRVRISESLSIAEFLTQLQRILTEVREREHSSLLDIKSWCNVPRRLPLFESVVIFENWLGSVAVPEWDEDLTVSSFDGAQGGSGYPLALVARPESALWLAITYDADRYGPLVIAQLLEHLRHVLRAIASDPDVEIESVIRELPSPWIQESLKNQQPDPPSATNGPTQSDPASRRIEGLSPEKQELLRRYLARKRAKESAAIVGGLAENDHA